MFLIQLLSVITIQILFGMAAIYFDHPTQTHLFFYILGAINGTATMIIWLLPVNKD